MNDFVEQSSIAGIQVFHTSQPKSVRIVWFFVFLLAFVLIGFYVFNIYTRYQVEPEFSYKYSQYPLREIPFPAITICSPLFARNQTVNLNEFLKNPTKNLTVEQQNQFAANLQACAPQLGSKFNKFFPLADPEKTVEILKSKYLSVDEAISSLSSESSSGCIYNVYYTLCSKIVNYVLTDFGYCFSFNLESFPTIFNTEIISDDFKCYRRDKLSKNYDSQFKNHEFTINDDNQSIEWTLEKGYKVKRKHLLPVRAMWQKLFQFDAQIKSSDLSNLCPTIGRSFMVFFHMPNEILTPFHEPQYVKKSTDFLLKAKLNITDESLRPFPPKKRNCYFEGERKLKFFKIYTKAHCQFECLANFTLAHCSCVKFSMPRENSTRICGLKETSCYIEVAKNTSCLDCLQTCTYIQYQIDHSRRFGKIKKNKLMPKIGFYFKRIFGEKTEYLGNYNIYQGFADFGGMLGTIFGASVISLIEIIYFLILSMIKKLFKIQETSLQQTDSEFVNSSTVHGVKFIFSKSKQKIIRIFWISSFMFAVFCCMYNSRESYWKLNDIPETESTENEISIEEIPFPAITICSPVLARTSVGYNQYTFLNNFIDDRKVIKNLTTDQFYFLIANNYWYKPRKLVSLIKYYNIYVLNITRKKSSSHRLKIDLFPYLNRSHFEVDELFAKCNFQGVEVKCSKLFRKVMTILGICYSFNMQSHREIFNSEISKNFDSYGRFEEPKETHWLLDQGYFDQRKNLYPVRASYKNTLEITLKLDDLEFKTNRLPFYKVYAHLPNEILSHVMFENLVYHDYKKLMIFSAKSVKMDESLRKYLPENRGCYFEDEKKLKYFKTYTRSNCIMECLGKHLSSECNCVSYLLLHDNSSRICGSADGGECYDESLRDFPKAKDGLNPCGCLPNCNEIEYDWYDGEQSIQEVPNVTISHIKFTVANMTMITQTEIHLAFGFQEFLTNVGGFLGLYMGCSVISIFEVFYFIFMSLHQKLIKRTNQVVLFKRELNYKQESSPEKIFSQNKGLTLVEIFDLDSKTFLNIFFYKYR